MTRREAISKALGGLGGQPIKAGDINARQLVDMLEALGLLTLDDDDVEAEDTTGTTAFGSSTTAK